MKENLHIGDPVEIYRNSDKVVFIIGKIDSIVDGIIKVGWSLYNPETNELTLRYAGEEKNNTRVIPDCTLEANQEARDIIETCATRDFMMDEIYFFLNNDKVKDHLDPDRIESALGKLTMEELTKITEIVLPYGMGEWGFKNIEELKKTAMEERHTNYCITYRDQDEQ